MKAIRSAARPEPSQTTTGTGGSSVTYSKTERIVFVPPSITNATIGILLCISVIERLCQLFGDWRTVISETDIHGCNFKLEMYFSSLLRKTISAPYRPPVPLSTSKKYACRLFRTAYLDLKSFDECQFRRWSIYGRLYVIKNKIYPHHGDERQSYVISPPRPTSS